MNSNAPDPILSQPQPRIHTLVIGYGNELRRDDGAGPRAARMILKRHIPGVAVEIYHQLLPEHAAKIATVDLVVFVDASLGDSREITVRSIHPASRPESCGHQCDPETLLELCDQIAARVPHAWFIHIPGKDFGIGETLSPSATHHLQAAVSSILRIIKDRPILTSRTPI